MSNLGIQLIFDNSKSHGISKFVQAIDCSGNIFTGNLNERTTIRPTWRMHSSSTFELSGSQVIKYQL